MSESRLKTMSKCRARPSRACVKGIRSQETRRLEGALHPLLCQVRPNRVPLLCLVHGCQPQPLLGHSRVALAAHHRADEKKRRGMAVTQVGRLCDTAVNTVSTTTRPAAPFVIPRILY